MLQKMPFTGAPLSPNAAAKSAAACALFDAAWERAAAALAVAAVKMHNVLHGQLTLL